MLPNVCSMITLCRKTGPRNDSNVVPMLGTYIYDTSNWTDRLAHLQTKASPVKDQEQNGKYEDTSKNNSR